MILYERYVLKDLYIEGIFYKTDETDTGIISSISFFRRFINNQFGHFAFKGITKACDCV